MEWLVFILSLVPFLELRAAIPAAVLAGYEVTIAFTVSTILNFLAIPVAYLLLDLVVPRLRRRARLVDRLYRWSEKRAKKWEKITLLGLFLFVGVPLPGTGAYSGTLVAHVLGLRRKWAVLVIAAGIVLAGLILFALIWLGIWILK